LGTVVPWLDLAGAGTAVVADTIAVVAVFGTDEFAVAALRSALPAWHTAHIAIFNRGAIGRTAVAAVLVAVVAGFGRGKDSISANGALDARLAPLGTGVPILDLTCLAAPVAASGVAVVALLVRILLAVPARRTVGRDDRRGVELNDHWATAASTT
jgi:hypothetical protein